MTAINWHDNTVEGRGLRRAFRKLLDKLESAEDANDISTLSRAMGYIAQVKANIAERDELEKRLEALETLAGITTKTVITA